MSKKFKVGDWVQSTAEYDEYMDDTIPPSRIVKIETCDFGNPTPDKVATLDNGQHINLYWLRRGDIRSLKWDGRTGLLLPSRGFLDENGEAWGDSNGYELEVVKGKEDILSSAVSGTLTDDVGQQLEDLYNKLRLQTAKKSYDGTKEVKLGIPIKYKPKQEGIIMKIFKQIKKFSNMASVAIGVKVKETVPLSIQLRTKKIELIDRRDTYIRKTAKVEESIEATTSKIDKMSKEAKVLELQAKTFLNSDDEDKAKSVFSGMKDMQKVIDLLTKSRDMMVKTELKGKNACKRIQELIKEVERQISVVTQTESALDLLRETKELGDDLKMDIGIDSVSSVDITSGVDLIAQCESELRKIEIEEDLKAEVTGTPANKPESIDMEFEAFKIENSGN